MPLLLVVGSLMALGGVALFALWFGFFVYFFKALLPLAIVAIGGVMVYFGWEERKDRKAAFLDFSSSAEAARYQTDAMAHQRTLDGLTETLAPSAAEGGIAKNSAAFVSEKTAENGETVSQNSSDAPSNHE